MNKSILSVRNLRKSYIQNTARIQVLDGLNLELTSGELIAIVGTSGTGKSTLLHLIGLLDNADSGEIIMNGENIANLSPADQAKKRLQYLGFVYQYHHLLKDFSVLDNLMLPGLLYRTNYQTHLHRAKELLSSLGIAHHMNSWPNNLSGGEQQRVAIARALINSPTLLLADEPTGNLDPHNADKVFNLLAQAVKQHMTAAIVVTHSLDLAAKADKVYELYEGVLRPKQL